MIHPARPWLVLTAGAVLVMALAVISAQLTAPGIAARLTGQAQRAIVAAGAGGLVTADFHSFANAPSRHPRLSPTPLSPTGLSPVSRSAGRLDEALRNRVAHAVAALPGVGGVRWADGTLFANNGRPPINPLHCQEDVEALLSARTIRFEEASARIDAASRELVGEVAAALRPCLGSVIAINGHTDVSGSEASNIALSLRRADAVRRALARRGIPADGLRARGVGSREPIAGLDPADPANRRIDFSVIATEPIHPTPVDTPGPH